MSDEAYYARQGGEMAPVEITGGEPHVVGGHGLSGYWIDVLAAPRCPACGRRATSPAARRRSTRRAHGPRPCSRFATWSRTRATCANAWSSTMSRLKERDRVFAPFEDKPGSAAARARRAPAEDHGRVRGRHRPDVRLLGRRAAHRRAAPRRLEQEFAAPRAGELARAHAVPRA